jgi:hypothetical protein
MGLPSGAWQSRSTSSACSALPGMSDARNGSGALGSDAGLSGGSSPRCLRCGRHPKGRPECASQDGPRPRRRACGRHWTSSGTFRWSAGEVRAARQAGVGASNDDAPTRSLSRGRCRLRQVVAAGAPSR